MRQYYNTSPNTLVDKAWSCPADGVPLVIKLTLTAHTLRLTNKEVDDMMIARLVVGFCSLAALGLAACSSEPTAELASDSGDWRDQVKTLKMGSKASEDDAIALRRIGLVQEVLEEATGIPVKIYQSNDYNGIIQALAAGQLDISTMGAGSYANVYAQIGDDAVPVLVRRDVFGASGYYSTIVVKADSPYQTIHDLKDQTLAYVDFNSTSGYIYPRWAMREEGIEPDIYFDRAAMAGGHIQSIMALANGQFDATVVAANSGTPETGFANGTLPRLARRGMIDLEDFRTIWAAGPIPNSPYVMRSELPQELQDIIRGAIASLPYDSPGAQVEMGRLPGSDYRAVDKDFFELIIRMRDTEIKRHRQLAAAR
ncbi:MAG: phosphate/phosphite/phosphonate ABC transporter substrate-binding protein [Pseudomonadota bacterium]